MFCGRRSRRTSRNWKPATTPPRRSILNGSTAISFRIVCVVGDKHRDREKKAVSNVIIGHHCVRTSVILETSLSLSRIIRQHEVVRDRAAGADQVLSK
jgi:hypothetical protein